MPTQDIYAINGGEQDLAGYSFAYGSKVPATGTLGDRAVPNIADISGQYQTRFDNYSYYTSGTP